MNNGPVVQLNTQIRPHAYGYEKEKSAGPAGPGGPIYYLRGCFVTIETISLN